MAWGLRRLVRAPPRRLFSLASHSARDGGLRVGVVGLGAIGTIVFTHLGSLLQHSARDESPLLQSLDAFVKPRHLEQLSEKRQISLLGTQNQASPFASVAFSEKNGSLVDVTGSVRIQTLDRLRRDELPPLNVVVLALKAYDSASVIAELQRDHRHRLTDDAVFVLLQNGLGALPPQEPGADASDSAAFQYVNGVTYVGGRVLSMGNVVVSGGLATEPSYFAFARGATASKPSEAQLARLNSLVGALQQSGLASRLLPENEMQTILWRKLIVNAAINPIASVLDVCNGHVGSCEWSRRSVEAVVHEAAAVAACEHVDLQATEEELVAYVLSVAQNTSSNVCSTLADLRRGARTEIDALTGQLLARGRRHGVPTPANALLFALVKALEAQRLRVHE